MLVERLSFDSVLLPYYCGVQGRTLLFTYTHVRTHRLFVHSLAVGGGTWRAAVDKHSLTGSRRQALAANWLTPASTR